MESNRDSIKKELCDSLFWTVAYQDMERRRIKQIIIVDVIPHKKQVDTKNIHPDSFYDRVEEYKRKYPHTFTSAGLNAVDKFIRKNPKHKVTVVVIDLSEMGLKIKNNLLAVIVMNPTQIRFVQSLLTSCRSLFN